MPTERNFGITMAAASGVIVLLVGLLRGRWLLWLGALGVVFLVLALAKPGLLRPLNRAWFLFGLVLHRIVNPLVLGILFLFVTLIGVTWRTLKRDPLRLKFEPSLASYWIDRSPHGPDRRNFPYQF
jgi:hypothetical protein